MNDLTKQELDLIRQCDLDEPGRFPVYHRDRPVVDDLVRRGFIEVSPGCSDSFGATEKGQEASWED